MDHSKLPQRMTFLLLDRNFRKCQEHFHLLGLGREGSREHSPRPPGGQGRIPHQPRPTGSDLASEHAGDHAHGHTHASAQTCAYTLPHHGHPARTQKHCHAPLSLLRNQSALISQTHRPADTRNLYRKGWDASWMATCLTVEFLRQLPNLSLTAIA